MPKHVRQCQVWVVNSSGSLQQVIGNGACGYSGDGGPSASASLNHPYGVAADSSGNVYIADTDNARIRKVSGGIITTVAGNGTQGYNGDGGNATSAELAYPGGVAVDTFGNLYIADTYNSRIRKVSGGIITTVAGNGTEGYNGDNIGATFAELDLPWAVALESSGNLYIADTSNSRVRMVSGGIITTVAGDGTFGYNGDNKIETATSGRCLRSEHSKPAGDHRASRQQSGKPGTYTRLGGWSTFIASGSRICWSSIWHD